MALTAIDMKDITVHELKSKIENKEDFFLLDVREPLEYNTFNLNAHLIPLGELMNRLDELDSYKDKEIVVHCRSGARSATAKHLLLNAGFAQVHNLLGGVLAWIEMEA